MKVACRQCGVSIPGDDINIQALAATCRNCGTVFGIGHLVEGAGAENSASKARPPVEMPAGMRIHKPAASPASLGDPYRSSAASPTADVILEWRWWHKRHIFIVGFAVMWCLFMVVWYSIAVAVGSWFMALFGVLHGSVGLGLAYWSLALVRNKTRISVRGEAMTISFAPMRWFGTKTLPVRDIEQLYTTEGVAYTVNDRPVPGFNVYARTKSGGKTRLVKNLPELEQALYVEQELEAALAIVDRPVPDEVPR